MDHSYLEVVDCNTPFECHWSLEFHFTHGSTIHSVLVRAPEKINLNDWLALAHGLGRINLEFTLDGNRTLGALTSTNAGDLLLVWPGPADYSTTDHYVIESDGAASRIALNDALPHALERAAKFGCPFVYHSPTALDKIQFLPSWVKTYAHEED